MVEISNIKVYELNESIIACRNAARTSPVHCYSDETEFEQSLNMALYLALLPSNSGHANFLTGIRVSFDIICPNYFMSELQRLDIVGSSSKMHRLLGLVSVNSFNKYVLPETMALMKSLVDRFKAEPSYESFMRLLSNCPQGIELFMRVNTNYMQLRTIYHQRKNHTLKEDWGPFCDMIRGLPYFEEFINNK